MKLNLLLNNPHDVLNGYHNVDPFSTDDVRIKADVTNLDHTYDNGEVDEIIANDVLDYFDSQRANAALNNWLSKLAVDGRLTLSVVDVREVMRGLLGGLLTIEQVNELIHGEQTQPWQTRRTSYVMSQIVSTLEGKGMKILSARIHEFRCVVTCQRKA